MKLVVTEHVNNIIEVETTTYHITIDVIDAYDRIPVTIGLMKGDLIGFRGAGDPVRIASGSVDGRILAVDHTTESGWAVIPNSSSSGSSVTLHNATGTIVPGGTVVKISSGYDFVKATSSDTENLYVTADDCDDDADVACYGVANMICQILCTADAVVIGDMLGVSSTNGIAETVLTNGFAKALTAKASGSVEAVDAIIIQSGFLPLTGGTISGNLEVTGTAKGQTPSQGDKSTKLATTEYVQKELAREVMHFASQAVSVASNAEIFRITDAGISEDTVVLECVFAEPNCIRSDVAWTSDSGYIVFTGTCIYATTADVTLGRKGN